MNRKAKVDTARRGGSKPQHLTGRKANQPAQKKIAPAKKESNVR